MISLNIATHKKREKSLKVTLLSALKQNLKPDVLNLYLNDYRSIPKWIRDLQKEHDHLKPVLGKSKKGDLGASAKFAFLDDQKSGIYVTLDDDLVADPRYLGYLVDMACRMPNSLIGLHGTQYKWQPIISFYHGPGRKVFYCYEGKPFTEAVDMLGTGVLAFNVGIGLSLSDFPEKNMTDPYLCKWAKENNIPMACLIREKGFVKELPDSQDSAIWKGVEVDDSKQTSVLNSIKHFRRLPLQNEFPVKSTGDASLEWSHMKHISNCISQEDKFVEFGSGISTKYWSLTIKNYTSIEHNDQYLNKAFNQIHVPIKKGWYDTTNKEFKKAIKEASVVLIDGPIGSTGERYNLPMNLLAKKRLIFVDDVHREKDMQQAKDICKAHGYKMTIIKGVQKDLAKLEK